MKIVYVDKKNKEKCELNDVESIYFSHLNGNALIKTSDGKAFEIDIDRVKEVKE
jgi:uncharacterized protein YjhX (UPF0386 family)